MAERWVRVEGHQVGVREWPQRMLRIWGHKRKPRQGEVKRGPNEGDKEAGVRTVPFGERHISFNLNSFTRSSSGVMVVQRTSFMAFESG